MNEDHAENGQPCCSQFFFTHVVDGQSPLVVLECCVCGRLWHQREDKRLVTYDQELFPRLRDRELE